MAAQQSLFNPGKYVHGGEHSIGKRKGARPLVTKRPMHLVLRAEAAKGSWFLLRQANARLVKEKIAYFSKRWDVRIYEWANGGTHLHLLVKGRTREGLKNFMRALSGSLAMAVTGAKKGSALGKRFWDLLLFTRVVEWGRAFRAARAYIVGHFSIPRHCEPEGRSNLTRGADCFASLATTRNV